MVNVYGDYSETGYNNPYYTQSTPSTRVGADYRNTVGRQNRVNAGLGSAYGDYTGDQLQQQLLQQQEQLEQQRQQQLLQQQQVQQQETLAQQAQRKAMESGAYYKNVGDTRTQAIVNYAGMLRQAGLPVPTDEEMAGVALAAQYKQAQETRGTRDDQYYNMELNKWMQNKVVVSDIYHDIGMNADVPIPANPFEYQADLAVETMKGGPKSGKEMFSPVSGSMVGYLPGEQGLQEVAWTVAKTGEPVTADFGPAVGAINEAGTRYGPYATLWGGPNYTETGHNAPQSSLAPQSSPDQFISSRKVAEKGTTIIPSTQVAGSFAPGIKFTGSLEVVPKERFTVTEKTIAPTGELPLIGVIPVISPVVALFQKEKIEKTYTGTPYTVEGTETVTGGSPAIDAMESSLASRKTDIESRDAQLKQVAARQIDRNNYWIGSESDLTTFNTKQSQLEQDVVAYNKDIEIFNQIQKENPKYITKETSVVTPAFVIEAEGLSPTEKVFLPVTTKISAFETSIREVLPKPEQGEQAVRMASLANIFSGPAAVTSMLTERFVPEAASGPQTIEGLVGLRGQYTQFYEAPALSIVSYAAGVGFGGVTRGVSVVGTKIASTGPRTASIVGYAGTITKWGLAGMYAGNVGYRATEELTTFAPETIVARTKSIILQEAVPMAIGFGMGYKIPETIKNGVGTIRENTPKIRPAIESGYTRANQAYNNIPTMDQLKYKWIELKEPSTAMSVPHPSERFPSPERASDVIRSELPSVQKYSRANRPARESWGGGSVSSSPTPRQESLRLNYNPTAPLRELDLQPISEVKVGVKSGIRGTLRGRWDARVSSSADEFASLPLKERWVAREAASAKTPVGTKGYYGSGKPTGGLQSGVGDMGTTVKSGRQSLEIRMPSSGINVETESLAPPRLEITPSRKTAQRSRMFDQEYEYVSRRLPPGTQRPVPGETIITKQSVTEIPKILPDIALTPTITYAQTPVLVPMHNYLSTTITTKTSIRDALRIQSSTQEKHAMQDTLLEHIPLTATITGTTLLGKQRQEQRIDQSTKQAQRQILIPKQSIIQLPVTITTMTPKPASQITSEISSVKYPVIPKVPKTPVIPAGISLGGVGGFSQSRPRSYSSWREHSPTWTPGEMGASLFTGHLRPVRVPRVPSVRTSKKNRNIRR